VLRQRPGASGLVRDSEVGGSIASHHHSYSFSRLPGRGGRQ
jgi:hypothetical protein